MLIFSWILLVLAIVDIMFTIGQLLMLLSMKLIIHEMHIGLAWFFVVGPPIFVLLFAVLSLNSTELSLFWLLAGYGVFGVAILFQAAATAPILRRRREWDEQSSQRMRVNQG